MTGKCTEQHRADSRRCREGSVTVEFITAAVVVLMPCLFALSEVYRFEHRARQLLLSAQVQCIESAVQGNRSGAYHVLAVPISDQIELMPGTRRIFGQWHPTQQYLSRTFYIGSGTGRD